MARQTKADLKKIRDENPEREIWRSARNRAKKEGTPFSIQMSDIVIPELCPILGIKLEKGIVGYSDPAATLDKIIPELGYVPGNVAVISFRANRIKSNATLKEMRKMVAWRREFEGARKEGQLLATPL